jgi:glycosyltransferase involved in cell wall biosynthesis
VTPDCSIVIGFRDRGLDTLRLALRSHAGCSVAGRIEVVVVDYGSRDPDAVRSAVEAEGARLLRVEAEGRWSRARALNHGIRRAARSDRILTTDSDILYGPRTVEKILDAIRSHHDPERVYALVQCRDLPPEFSPRELGSLDWQRMGQAARRVSREGAGGCACFPRSFVEDVRGYDERMEWWGAEDNDLASRAESRGLETVWIDSGDAIIYHVWHESMETTLAENRAFRQTVARNRSLLRSSRTVYRNLDSWGGLPSQPPPVSVVIVTRDRAHLLRQAIDSTLDQSRQNFELVVVDDGSTDDTRRVVDDSDDPRIRYFHQPPSGIPVARNLGVREARGEYVCIMDDDDLMLPDRVRDQLAAAGGGNAGSYGGWIDFDEGSGELVRNPGKRRTPGTILFGNNVMVHAASMIRRDVLLEHPYNEKYAYGSDYDLNLRLVQAGHELRHTGSYLILRRLHGGNVTTTERESQRGAARLSVAETVAALPEEAKNTMREEAKRARDAEVREIPETELKRLLSVALGKEMTTSAPIPARPRGVRREPRSPVWSRAGGIASIVVFLVALAWVVAIGARMQADQRILLVGLVANFLLTLGVLVHFTIRLRRQRRHFRQWREEEEAFRARLQQTIEAVRREER